MREAAPMQGLQDAEVLHDCVVLKHDPIGLWPPHHLLPRVAVREQTAKGAAIAILKVVLARALGQEVLAVPKCATGSARVLVEAVGRPSPTEAHEDRPFTASSSGMTGAMQIWRTLLGTRSSLASEEIIYTVGKMSGSESSILAPLERRSTFSLSAAFAGMSCLLVLGAAAAG